jgi:tetratricopeptide (TPR) repeat protein
MSSKRQKTKSAASRVAPSGSGGPGSFRGGNYQIDCAILKSLYLISQHLYEPLKPASITMEPRVVHLEAITRWDIQTDPPLVAIEAKAHLSKDDLVEFLQRAGELDHLLGELQLVYGQCGTALLNSAVRLNGLAIECGSDVSKFNKLVTREEVPSASIILKALGPDCTRKLPGLVFENLPERQLKRELEVRSRELFPEHPDRLVDFLSRRFHDGSMHRQRYEIAELVNAIEQVGMALSRPAEVKLSELSVPAISALAMLQATPFGLPGEVVASATKTATEELREMLSGSDLLSLDKEIWRIRPLPFQIHVQDRAELLCRAFESLLNFLSRHESEMKAEEQISNTVLLARPCLRVHPHLALQFFQATEHIVKNLGDKHLLLEISNLCIDADRHRDGDNAETCAKARAQAILCGTSWVFQRTGRLSEARVWAEKSLSIGQAIGWDRNTAFAKKCMGRIERLEAEQPETNASAKAKLLQASAEKLREAIELFSRSGEFGPTHLQVGDCYSLLGRTYLVARRQHDSLAAMRQAYEILPPGSNKEYFDLLILMGDFEVLWGSRDQADSYYSDVIDQHSQESRDHSEILARALAKRAANRAKFKRKQTALSDYERAAQVWQSLNEYEEAAKAKWDRIVLEGTTEVATLQLFSSERSLLTRLCAFEMYREHLGKSNALAHRSRPTEIQVTQYLKEARKRSALDYPEW